MLKFSAALLLLLVSLRAQNSAVVVLAGGAEVTIAEGSPVLVAPRVTATLERDHLRIRNGGDPDRFNTSAFTPAPFYFREIRVKCPGRRPLLWPMDLSRSTGPDEWTLAPADAPKHAHHEADDPAQPWYAPSKTFHMLDGGDTFYARLTTYADPYELTATPAVARDEALRIFDADEGFRAQWPLLRRVFDLYAFDATSMDLRAAPRNFGWFLIPEFFVAKYTSTNIELARGWYAWPDHQLPGDGICNAHYGHDASWLASFLFSGDPMRRTVGLALVRQKCATGLFDVDRAYPSCRYVGMWRGEKAGLGRRGSGLGPTPAKEWDAGLLMARALVPGDPLLERAFAVRKARLLGVDPADIWNGAGGGRLAGAYLRNLRDYFVATGDVAFRAKASAFIAHVWRKVDAAAVVWDPAHPGNPLRWFPNSYDVNKTAAWEEATLYAQLYWWAEFGVWPGRLADLDAMLDWMIRTCSGPRGATGEYQVAYQADVVAGTFTSNTPMNCAWWVPLAPTVRERMPQHAAAADAWTATAFGRIGQTWADVDAGRARIAPWALGVESGPEGPGAHKMRAYAGLAIRR